VTEFDVFLSHNGQDKPAVRDLAKKLRAAGVSVWLDVEQLRPGLSWLSGLESGIRASRSVAVLVGSDGLGPWQEQEQQAALQLAVDDKRPVIPVLLPDAPSAPTLPLFLLTRTWVDLRGGYTDKGIDPLIWGITGKKPDAPERGENELDQDKATTPAQLWPDQTPNSQGAETADCYSRLHAICASGEAPRSEERLALWQAIKKNRPSSFLAWQLAPVARWSVPEYLEVDEHFTPLQVSVRIRESADAPAEKQQLPFDTLNEAMTAVFDEQMAPASVIFAPPGGGKSTSLRHYQLQQARRLGEGERLVFYVQLRDYQADELSEENRKPAKAAFAWLESEWRRETDQAPPLLAFMQQGSVTLLLDGLNEIPRVSDEAYKARVGEWRDLVDAVDSRYPGVRLLFACRPWITRIAWTSVATHACPRSRCRPWSRSVSRRLSTSDSNPQ
jgi:hypothetical protein